MLFFVRKDVSDYGRADDRADDDVQPCGQRCKYGDKIEKAACGDGQNDEQQNAPIVAGRGDDDRHEHGVECNAESAHEHIVISLACAVCKRSGKQFADSCAESGSAQPAAERTGH